MNPVQRIHLCVLILMAVLWAPSGSEAARRRNTEPAGRQLFTSPQANPIVLDTADSRVYAVHTTNHRVAVIDTATNTVSEYIQVGMDPVSLAFRPDGLELWVSNHVSDTVSVIDTDPASPTFHQVVETIQELDAHGATLFDEPVGIAFASNTKAYVALSSRNDIAIIDAANYVVTGRIHVTAQEPRAITVSDNGLLFVAAFESGNQSQISACSTLVGTGIVGDPCSLGLLELQQFATDPNIPGAVKNIVQAGLAPDRDLFVYDTSDDSLVAAVEHVGTLLYGLTTTASGQVFVTQTDARNTENGDHGENLIDLGNRIFTDEVATVSCTTSGCGAVSIIDLPPGPPGSPVAGDALSTPYGIALSGDEQLLVGTSAGNSRLFTLTPAGAVLGTADLNGGPASADFGQQIPRGVALRSDVLGAAETAYVLNTLDHSISVVDVTDPSIPAETSKVSIRFGSGTTAVDRGRVAFNNSFASTSGTFSCGSCHPDGNTDQLLWRIGGACFFGDCEGTDEPRTTMPIRGLANTVPLHWDGTLGDPFDQTDNGAFGPSSPQASDCVTGDADGDHDCFVDLVDEALAGVMCDQSGACPLGGNELSTAERDDMAHFLAGVAFPPARSRRMDESVSQVGDGVLQGATEVSALEGFRDFFTDRGGQNDPNTCADGNSGCHELPLGVADSSETLAGFDAPTMRGLTDRYLQFSMGLTNARRILVQANAGLGAVGASPLENDIRWDPAEGFEEVTTFGAAFLIFEGVYNVRPMDLFQMFEEASTGLPGATGRQVTLNDRTTTGGLQSGTEGLLSALEQADDAGLVNLRVNGRIDLGAGLAPVTLSWRGSPAQYRNEPGSLVLSQADLVSAAQAGDLVATATAHLRSGYGNAGFPQPLLAPDNPGSGSTGNPDLPHITGGASNPAPFDLQGVGVRSDAVILVDGQTVGGTISCNAGVFFPTCTTQDVSIDLTSRPANGLHLLQVRNGAGPLSNEIPLCVGSANGC